ncbi:MAG: DUF4363 family protein [Clostridia bacterium]|nr:DUF4363 family protein [Clostridia bacterium]
MNGRGFVTLAVAVILLIGVISGQILLHNISTDLADSAEEICILIGEEQTEVGGERLKALSDHFFQHKKLLLLFLNDSRIHEIQRSLARAQRLAEDGDWSPALEALSDFSTALRELAETHHPTWENVLKIHESFGIAS